MAPKFVSPAKISPLNLNYKSNIFLIALLDTLHFKLNTPKRKFTFISLIHLVAFN